MFPAHHGDVMASVSVRLGLRSSLSYWATTCCRTCPR